MPQPTSPDVSPPVQTAQAARPRTRRLRRRSDRIIRLVAVMAILGAIVISAVMWQQSSTIAKQRALIQLMFQDTMELNKLRQRELQRKQEDKKHSDSSTAQPSAGPYADGCMVRSGPCT